MREADKLIKTVGFLALALIIILAGVIFYQKIDFSRGFKDSFSPTFFNQDETASAAAKNNRIVKMLFVGDLMLDRHVKEKIKNNDPAYLFQGLKNNKFDFNKYDLTHGNLEGAVTNGGNHYPPVYSYDFAFTPEVIAKLKDYNFQAFNLANNHLTDQGERGVIETRANLTKLNFLSYGCADAQAGDCSFKIYQAGGLRIGLVGLSQVYKKLDLGKVKKIIADLGNRTDLVIVNAHWGAEYEHVFNKTQQDLAHKLIEAGADIIIGHHPHVVQGLEIYETKRAATPQMRGAQANEIIRRPIFYSLGNFIFDQYFSRDTQEELAVEIVWSAAGQSRAVLYPMFSKQSQPSLMIGEEREKYLAKIAGWSKGDKELMKQIRGGEITINF